MYMMFPTLSGEGTRKQAKESKLSRREGVRGLQILTDEHPYDHLLGHTHLRPFAVIVREKDRFGSSE
jgi:hypothetical protein